MLLCECYWQDLVAQGKLGLKGGHHIMQLYNCDHNICFLAPTGSAAALIEGMTVHKGLGIKVKSSTKGKGNWEIGCDNDDYNVIISVTNCTKLCDEWKDVDVAAIDEVSLLSAELTVESDATFWFAKEKPDKWFGGIMVIFSSDFFQYPPVSGTPLYNPINAYDNQTNDEIN